MRYFVSPSKVNVVANALSKKYVGSLVAVVGRQPHLLHNLENLGAQFTIWDSGVLLARLNVQSNVVERIKLSQRDDP